jgi:hypothetical protein
MTNRDRVVAALQFSTSPLDDDQLSERAGVRPRQTVNQICRDLELRKVLRRYVGRDGKIINELIDSHAVASDADISSEEPAKATAHVQRGADHTRPPGSSQEQRDAERVMLDVLGEQLKVILEPAVITVPSGARVEVDGADEDRTVLVECWAHQGPPKSAQRHKVLTDALKLTWISSTIYPRPRLYLCLSDILAARPFMPTAKSWAAQALKDLDVTVVVVDLPAELRETIKQAQQRQYR